MLAVWLLSLLMATTVLAQGDSQTQPRTSVIDPNQSPEENIRRVRERLLYPYENDKYNEVKEQTPLVQVNLRFPLPFYGFLFNYTWISLHGYLGFSYASDRQERPMKLPVDEWPLKPDPSFIGPFHMEARVGAKLTASDQEPGVYLRVIPNIGMSQNVGNSGPEEADRIRAEESAIRDSLQRDISEGMIGTEFFDPKHVVIVTWNNMTFGGGGPGADKITNTFQAVLTTDEVRSYVIFNYDKIAWTSSTQSGGSTADGTGGTPAFIGFNAGNGSSAFEYMPYSQSAKITNLISTGFVNGKPGRHIFRMDEEILPGVCNYDPGNSGTRLVLSPESGNMLGGTLVNVTGPCFKEGDRIRAKFKDIEVNCQYRTRNHATCITPPIYYIGYVSVYVSIGDGSYQFSTLYYLEPPAEAKEVVWFKDREVVNQLEVTQMEMHWATSNLTWNTNARVQISLWGYREQGVNTQLEFIDMISESMQNSGNLNIDTSEFADRNNWAAQDMGFGFIQINLTNPTGEGLTTTPILWSRPIPLGWYFLKQWEKNDGDDWSYKRCRRWIDEEVRMNTFAKEVFRCPCTLKQALADVGHFSPDTECDMFGNTGCTLHRGAKHCVRSGLATIDGSGQQCCYNQENLLILSVDTHYGGSPSRAHPFGGYPFNVAGKVPSLANWKHDIVPFHYCCIWNAPDSDACYEYRYRRASQDCVGYQTPNVSVAFGDPHFITFDNVEYDYNGLGEYVLTRVSNKAHKIDFQGRFTQVVDEKRAIRLPASELSAVVAADNISSIVEVQLRNIEARWRYRLNVLVDHKRIYFDRPHMKVQAFRGVTVYVPGNVHNQSRVLVQFQSGAGMEVIEGYGHMSARIFLPQSFMNLTRGLLGNWSGNPLDDYTLPDGSIAIEPASNPTNFENVYDKFGMKWVVKDSEEVNNPVGKSLFYHEYGRTSATYFNSSFRPIFDKRPEVYQNQTFTANQVDETCMKGQGSYQCAYDYIVTQNRDFALSTQMSENSFQLLKSDALVELISCGSLPTPRHGTKSNTWYFVGAVIKFSCDVGYKLIGEESRSCFVTGEWSYPNNGVTECIDEKSYYAQQAGAVAGYVLAAVIPIVILVTCGVAMFMRHRRANDRSGFRHPRVVAHMATDHEMKTVKDYDNGPKGHSSSVSGSNRSRSPD